MFFASFGVFVIVPVLCAAGLQNPSQGKPQAKPAVTTAKSPTSETEEKNPIEATPEKLAEAKTYFGYDCAMCHGPAGDGKGDLATWMILKMNDWRDSSRLEAMSDEEIFELIVKGKGRMVTYSVPSTERLLNAKPFLATATEECCPARDTLAGHFTRRLSPSPMPGKRIQ